MTDESLRVEPVDVHLAGAHIDVAATDFLAGHVSAQERVAAAQGGFIGASAARLAELAADWQEESAGHHRELCEHAENLRTAAAKYDTTDTDAATDIDNAASDLAERMGL